MRSDYCPVANEPCQSMCLGDCCLRKGIQHAAVEAENTRLTAELAELKKAIEAHEARKVPNGWQLVPKELLLRAQDSLGSFVSDQGWGASDMDTFDEVSALLASAPPAPQASRVVEFPTNANEAEAMQKLGYSWLEQHAPERLKQVSVVKQEPVAWLVTHGKTFQDRAFTLEIHAQNSQRERNDDCRIVPLYTHPAPVREPLTDDFAKWYWQACDSSDPYHWMKAALAAQRILATSKPEADHGITKDALLEQKKDKP